MPSTLNTGPATTSETKHPGAECLRRRLEQHAAVLRVLDDEQYVSAPVGTVRCSVGQQTRHVLDHIRTFLSGLEAGRLHYDDRQRGTDVELKRRVALDEIEIMDRDLRRVSTHGLDEAVCVVTRLDADTEPIDVGSTVGRELASVLSHTIHHHAMIGVMAATLDVPVPEHFGYAPATIAHLRSC